MQGLKTDTFKISINYLFIFAFLFIYDFAYTVSTVVGTTLFLTDIILLCIQFCITFFKIAITNDFSPFCIHNFRNKKDTHMSTFVVNVHMLLFLSLAWVLQSMVQLMPDCSETYFVAFLLCPNLYLVGVKLRNGKSQKEICCKYCNNLVQYFIHISFSHSYTFFTRFICPLY